MQIDIESVNEEISDEIKNHPYYRAGYAEGKIAQMKETEKIIDDICNKLMKGKK